jgi:hypothetical protein
MGISKDMTPELSALEDEFDRRMFWISNECYRRYGRRPARFHALVAELRGVGAAKRLLASDKDPVAWQELDASRGDGFDITMEYLVVQNRYRPLFNRQEIETAEKRLAWFPEQAVDRRRYSDRF